jgi:hypothetical protein
VLLLFLIKEVIQLNKANVLKFLNGTKAKISKHSPAILIGFAIVSGGAAVVLAVKETPKALKRIEEKKEEYQVDKLSPWETVKTTWPCYVPAAATFVFAAGCALGSQSIHVKRNAALAAAYKISETALVEYRDKVVETIGEKKEKAVRTEVAKEQIKKTPYNPQNVYSTGKGKTICFDTLTSRYFECDVDFIKAAAVKLNQDMQLSICSTKCMNDFYYAINLDPIDPSVGDNLGWSATYPIHLDIDYGPVSEDDSRACAVIGHYNPPRYDW